jgi:tetratricopeptide (TPR) repeat protein
MKIKFPILSLTTLIMLGIGCDFTSKVELNNQSAEEITADGWNLYFETKQYADALNMFKEAIVADAEYADAHNGAGWTSARLSQLDEAVGYFDESIRLNTAVADAHAGRAFAKYAKLDYSAAISSATTALQKNSSWNFEHDTTLNYKDLHLLLAACHFATGAYQSSLTEVKLLNASFTANITTIAGKAALAEEIERLRTIV